MRGDIIENYYEILHIANFAEIEVVKASYKAMSKLYHPDINKNVDPNVIVKINLAYEILGDQDKKIIYDKKLSEFLEKQYTDYQKNQKETVSFSSDKTTDIEDESLSKRFAKFIFNTATLFAESYSHQANDVQQAIENAYYHGSSMSDEQLVRQFLRSKGAIRKAYAQALLDRSLLYRENGKLVPSYTFKRITKGLK